MLSLLAGCSPPSEATAPGQSDAWFEDVTARTGVEFVHRVDSSHRYEFSELMAPGVALLDFDNDGKLDLYLIHNVRADELGRAGTGTGATNAPIQNRLYHQQPDGRFKDVSAGSGLETAGLGNGIAIGDVNNDGRPDVFVTEYDRVRLFLNRGDAGGSGGRFRDVTAEAGLTNAQWSVPAAFLDYDRDGWLDLVIGNYLDYDPAQRCADSRDQPDYCGPQGFRTTLTRLLRNRGAALAAQRKPGVLFIPQFEDVTVGAGLARAPGKAMQILCADFDGDRRPDIFVTDDGMPNRLFMNQGDGTFTEEALVRGVAYTGMGTPAANMGIAVGDVDSNGLFDLFVPHLTEENHTLWRQVARGLFQDGTAMAGLLSLPWHGTGFGAVLADFDCDGDVDLAVVNGRVRRPVSWAGAGGPTWRVTPGLAPFWASYAEPAQVFANNGQGGFAERSAANPALCAEAFVGRGLALGDIDNDGGLDLLAVGIAGPARLVRNRARRGHWLGVSVVDPAAGGRDAIGAEVTVFAGGRRFWRLAQPASSYASSHDPRIHFGLGDLTRIEGIEVLWPDGPSERFVGPTIDRYVTLKKGEGGAIVPLKSGRPRP